MSQQDLIARFDYLEALNGRTIAQEWEMGCIQDELEEWFGVCLEEE